MKISEIRSYLYKAGKYLGDYSAIKNGTWKRRLKRRIAGKITGRLMRKIK